MKKFSTSVLIALFAIHVCATSPSRLSAVVIDTLYHASVALIIEYEVISPFEQVSLSVQSSWRSALKDTKPVNPVERNLQFRSEHQTICT